MILKLEVVLAYYFLTKISKRIDLIFEVKSENIFPVGTSIKKGSAPECQIQRYHLDLDCDKAICIAKGWKSFKSSDKLHSLVKKLTDEGWTLIEGANP